MSAPGVTTRAMTPEDAAAVRALMLRCYGETYFDGLYYDAEELARAVATGEQYSAIAIGPSGDVVAHLGLRCPPGSRTADSTMAIVDPQFRSRGLMVELGRALAPFFRKLDLYGIWLQAVTVHPYTQRASLKGGSGVTGIELGYVPSGMTFLEVDSAVTRNPTPALILFQPLQPAPAREIHVPERYASVIQEASDRCRLEREVSTASEPLSTGTRASIRSVLKPRQEVCYLWADAWGEDLLARVAQITQERDSAGTRALYLNLPLDGGATDALVSHLHKLNFIFAGVLPEYGGRDWLTLQRVSDACLDVESIVLTSDTSRALLDFVLGDRNP